MRLIEIILFLANLITFITLFFTLSKAGSWMHHLAPITLLLAFVQVLVEGPRWQMFPTYILSVIFFIIWLLRITVPVCNLAKHKPLYLIVVGLVILGLTISIVLPIALPVFSFPNPSGPYKIGTVTYHFTDVSRDEVFSNNKNTHRELMVQIWYPAPKNISMSHASYLQNSDTVTSAVARLHNLPGFVLSHLKYVTTNAAVSVPVANDKLNYPVLIYLEGLTGYRQMSTFQVEELVSHGYIVVGIDQPGAAASVVFPDGHHITGLSKTQMDPLTQQSISVAKKTPLLNGQEFKEGIIPYFAQDVSFTLNHLATINNIDPNNILTGKLDQNRTGIFGVSFGGIIAAEACLKDPRIKACMVMDVNLTSNVVQKGLKQPSMFITRDADTMRLERQKSGGWTEKDIEQTQTTMRAVYNSLPGNGYFVQVPGMFHIDLTDIAYVSPIFPKVGFSGPIGVERSHDIINAYSLAFFDKNLKGTTAELLSGPLKQYPEVLFNTRRR